MADMDTDVDLEVTTPAEAGGDPGGSIGGVAGGDSDVTPDFPDEWTATGAQKETMAGLIMIGLVVVAALFFRWRPGPTFLDRWGFSLVHPALGNVWWHRITYVRTMSFLVASSILSALVVYTRDRWRALALLIAPISATMLTEYVLKPLIARRYAQVLSFPSGTTTLVGSTATAWVIAVPRWIRLPVVIIAAFFVGLECMAVVALEWHFPTDAIGGIVFGAGMVLLFDGLIHLAVDRVRADREASGTTPNAPVATPDAPAATPVA
ncbi:MAG: hypothetical protein ABSF84_12710 [Acidimicrobiales bacterium]|jgi:membrane-associated phospholipid phosphatase